VLPQERLLMCTTKKMRFLKISKTSDSQLGLQALPDLPVNFTVNSNV